MEPKRYIYPWTGDANEIGVYMNFSMIIHPYRTLKYVIWFTIPAGILAFMGVGFFISKTMWGATLLCTVLGALSMLLSILHTSASRKAVLFDDNGLHIIGDTIGGYRYIAWDKLAYSYYIPNIKAQWFLILSPNALCPKEAKRIVNRLSNFYTLCIDDVVVIWIDRLKDLSQIKTIIDDHAIHTDTYST